MLHDDFSEKFDEFTRDIIRRKINQLIGQAGFTKQDREDLTNDFFAHVLQAMPSLDPNIGSRKSFIKTVVARYFANVLRDKRVQKRDPRRIGSLGAMIDIGGGEQVELLQTISQRELDARRRRHRRSDEEFAQLVQDVADVMAKLPDELRELAQRLKTQNVSEISRDMGIPRTTLNESVRRLRRRFENAGLKNYL